MADIVQRIGLGLGGVLDSPLVRIGLMTLAVSAAIAWIASAYWCFRDMRMRTNVPIAPYLASGAIILSSPLLFPFGIGLYLLVRPQETAHERETRHLARFALSAAVDETTCPACALRVDTRWAWCPSCAAALARTCATCGGRLETDWSICPWCAREAQPSWRAAKARRSPLPGAASTPGPAVAGGVPASTVAAPAATATAAATTATAVAATATAAATTAMPDALPAATAQALVAPTPNAPADPTALWAPSELPAVAPTSLTPATERMAGAPVAMGPGHQPATDRPAPQGDGLVVPHA